KVTDERQRVGLCAQCFETKARHFGKVLQMQTGRRQFLGSAVLGAAAALTSPVSRAQSRELGIPGPHPGKVIAIEHPGSALSGKYEPEAIRQMMQRGMTELTEAPAWQDAWRTMFRKGDVVAIKVSPVGGPGLCSDASVLHSILDGLNQAGVPDRDIIVFS